MILFIYHNLQNRIHLWNKCENQQDNIQNKGNSHGAQMHPRVTYTYMDTSLVGTELSSGSDWCRSADGEHLQVRGVATAAEGLEETQYGSPEILDNWITTNFQSHTAHQPCTTMSGFSCLQRGNGSDTVRVVTAPGKAHSGCSMNQPFNKSPHWPILYNNAPTLAHYGLLVVDLFTGLLTLASSRLDARTPLTEKLFWSGSKNETQTRL